MKEQVRITKLVKEKRVPKADGTSGFNIVEDVKLCFDKDVDEYLAKGFKDVEVFYEVKNFTSAQHAQYIDGVKTEKKAVVISPEERAMMDFEQEVRGSTGAELAELCEQYGIDVVLGQHKARQDKQDAVIDAMRKKGFEEKKAAPKGSSGIELKVENATVKGLEEIVEELGLDINLSDYSKKSEKQAAIMAVLDNKE